MRHKEKFLNEDQTLKECTSLSPADIMHIIKMCIDNSIFEFNGQLYRQINGLPMGCNISPVLSEIFLEEFMERRHIDLFSCNIVKFIRYVDDCLVIASSIEAVNLYNYLNNNVHSNIKFTIETNINNELPFLDMLLKIIDGRVYTSVYRKPTHTDRYLNYKSNHPPHVKNGVIKNLVHRASLHGSSFQEIENIKKAMIANDFPPKKG